MPDIRDVLATHAASYPKMEPRDAVKLIVQSVRGGGHLIGDPSSSLARLEAELAAFSPAEQEPLAEDIGGGFCRLHLRTALYNGLSAQTINGLFVLSSQKGRDVGMDNSLAVLEGLAGQGKMPFSIDECVRYVDQYRESGCPVVSHSQTYRDAYAPAYRVIAQEYVRFLPLLTALDRAFERVGKGGHVSLAIDGRCGSGKTTLAALLERLYPARVLHMDDFFLPPPLRTPARLAQPGGNVHHERFMDEAAEGIRTGRAITHRVFDCSIGNYGSDKTLPAKPLTIVEGAYCMRPEMEPLYDVTVFLNIPQDEQLRRIAYRNGEEGLRAFQEKWIPLEEKYFSALRVRQRCGICL